MQKNRSRDLSTVDKRTQDGSFVRVKKKKGSKHRSLGKCSAGRSIDLPKWGTHPPFLRSSLVSAKRFFFRLLQIFSIPQLPFCGFAIRWKKSFSRRLKTKTRRDVNRGLRHDRGIFLFFFRKFNTEQRKNLVIFKVPKSLWELLNPFEWELIPLEMNFYWDSTVGRFGRWWRWGTFFSFFVSSNFVLFLLYFFCGRDYEMGSWQSWNVRWWVLGRKLILLDGFFCFWFLFSDNDEMKVLRKEIWV